MPLLTSFLDNRRRAKARATLRHLLAKHQACTRHNAFPRRTSNLLIEGCWRGNHEVFAGDLVKIDGPMAGVRQPKPRYQIVAVVALSEAIEGLYAEAPDSPMFFTLLSAHRELLQRTAAEVGRGLIPDGLEERLLRWGIEVYNKASVHPEVQARFPALSLPLANKKTQQPPAPEDPPSINGAREHYRTERSTDLEHERADTADDASLPPYVPAPDRRKQAQPWSAETTALRLLALDLLSHEQIAEATGLSVAEIDALNQATKG